MGIKKEFLLLMIQNTCFVIHEKIIPNMMFIVFNMLCRNCRNTKKFV